MFAITRNHVTEGYLPRVDRMPLYGIERAAGLPDELPREREKSLVKFRLYDDDGELMFEGELDADDEADNQTAALRWGETEAGATTIQVLRDGSWKEEIC